MTQVDILICTYLRDSLDRCLNSVVGQTVPADMKLRIIVADNSPTQFAQKQVQKFASLSVVPITYLHAPKSNISVARNACLGASDADWVVFIDDDEFAPQGWLAQLWEHRSDADVLFGEVCAIYPPDAPRWVCENDVHSTRIQRDSKAIETGFAGNVLLRWKNTAWFNERFDLGLGKLGGEDTDFFNRLFERGAKLSSCSKAIVYEPVEPARLSWAWMLRRKFRAGQSYGDLVAGAGARLVRALSAVSKICFCFLMLLVTVFSPKQRGFWVLRGVFHCGVFMACIRNPNPEKTRSLA